MSMNDLRAAIDIIEENPSLADFEGPRDEALIRHAEAAVGFAFPETYREFVRRFGVGGFGGFEFYGVIDRNFHASSVPNGIWLTLSQRKSGLPGNLLVIGATGDGEYYCLRCSVVGEAPVVLYAPGAKAQRDEIVADDFGAFLLEQVRAALE